MALNPSQTLTLKNAILAEPNVASFLAQGDDGSIALYYNDFPASATKAWKTSFTGTELFESMDLTKFDALTAGKRDAWRLMIDMGGVSPAKNKYRKAVTDVWGATDATTILTDMLENATRAEILFGGNNATQSGVSGLVRSWSGLITGNDVAAALRG